MFTPFESWGIAVATIYFIIGFPSNVLSIIVCFKSLFYRCLRRKRLKNNSNKFQSSLKIMASTNFESQHEILNENKNNEIDQNTSKNIKLHLSVPFIKSSLLNKDQSLSSKPFNLNHRAQSFQFNPHRKCFELYLIEISFCDLIVIGYNSIEWLLLVLSKKSGFIIFNV